MTTIAFNPGARAGTEAGPAAAPTLALSLADRLAPPLLAVWKGMVGAVAVTLFYQVVQWSGLVNPRVLPPVTDVLAEMLRLAVDGAFLSAVVATLGPALVGLTAASLIGVSLGLLLGGSRLAEKLSRGLIDMMRSLPGTALIPIFIFSIGVGTEMKIALVTYVTLWPILFNTIYGIGSVDKVAIESARSCRVSGFALWRRVMLPSAAPFIVTGIRYALPISIVIVISSEIVIGNPYGIGGYLLMQQANVEYRPDVIYAVLLAAGVLGFILNSIANIVADRLVGWETRRGEPQ